MTDNQSSISSSPVWGVMLLVLVLFGTWVVFQDVSATEIWRLLSSTTENSPLLVLAIFGLYLIRPATGFPSAVLSFLVGAKFGLLQGLPMVVIGSVITGLPAYYFGRHSQELPSWVPGVDRFQKAGENFLDHVGIYRSMFAASLSPTPLDPVAWAAGMVGVRLPAFILATFVAAVPWAGAYCYSGAVTGDIAASPKGPPLEAIAFGGAIAGLLLIRPTINWVINRQIPMGSSDDE